MSRYGIFVFDRNGPALLPEHAQALAQFGCEMALSGAMEMMVDYPGMCGKLTTRLMYGSLVSIHGMLFGAELFTPKGTVKLRFLLPVGDLVPRDLQEAWQESTMEVLDEDGPVSPPKYYH
jgi:hypothetical protein